MRKNIGKLDRTIRLILGIALLALFFILPGNARWWGLLGLVLIATALINFCPIWFALGVNTDRK